MRTLARFYVALCVVGATHAVSIGRPCRFAGLHYPGSPAQHAITVGTPLSAPPFMLLALLIAARRDRPDVTRALAMMFLVGIAAEVDTWATLRRPTSDPISTMCVALDIALPATMLGAAR